LPYGGAAKVWLHHALQDLNQLLGGHLVIRQGDPAKIIPELMAQQQINHLFHHHAYDAHGRELANRIHQQLKPDQVHAFHAQLLWDPDEVLKQDGTPYRVFTPFYRKGCLGVGPLPSKPLPAPQSMTFIQATISLTIDELKLMPNKAWGTTITAGWDISTQGAHQRLEDFIQDGLSGYYIGRDFPAKQHTSRLSPYLRWGQISVQHIWARLAQLTDIPEKDLDHFKSELGWREFSYHLLYHFPDMTTVNLNRQFDAFPWRDDPAKCLAWQQGQTGIPIVDAAMRQLYATGYMHNRLRMIAGSFLVKNLGIHWHQGQAWFWDCLFDADIANNSAGWQWIAGCGADAAPYFRIFNPILQAEKFDPTGQFIHQWVKELRHLSPPACFKPWAYQGQADLLSTDTYPKPIVDLSISREEALAAYQSIKKDS
jgi:deoxyribodipyrimidine photo-lyase